MENFITLGKSSGNCGWVCRQLNKIGGVVAAVSVLFPAVGAYYLALKFIVKQIDDMSSSGVQSRGGLTDPTPAEELIMKDFSEKLGNFIKNILIELNNNFTDVSIVNNQLVKMCIVSEYFANNETTGLSPNAVALRLQLIEAAFAPIKEEIQKNIPNVNLVPGSVTAIQTPFNGLFISSVQGLTYNCYQYEVSGNSTQSPPTKPNIRVPIIKGEGIKFTGSIVSPLTLNAIKTGGNGIVQPSAPVFPSGNVREPLLPTAPTNPQGVVNYPIKISAPENPMLPTAPPKVLSNKKVDVKTIVKLDGLPIGEINVYVEGVAMLITKQDGIVSLKNIPENAEIKFANASFPSAFFEAAKVPSVVNIDSSGFPLNDVTVVKDPKKKGNFWLILLLFGTLVYGGYRYSIDNKTKKVIKTKI